MAFSEYMNFNVIAKNMVLILLIDRVSNRLKGLRYLLCNCEIINVDSPQKNCRCRHFFCQTLRSIRKIVWVLTNENSWSEDKGGLISEMLSLNLAQISKKRCQITNLSWALSTLWKSSFWLRIVIWHNPFEIWAKAKNFLRLGHLLNAVGYRIMKP